MTMTMTSPIERNEGHMSFKRSCHHVEAALMIFRSSYQQQALSRQSQGFNPFLSIILAQETKCHYTE